MVVPIISKEESDNIMVRLLVVQNVPQFVKTIKDKKDKEWAIYDHNLDSELDVHLINSFPKN